MLPHSHEQATLPAPQPLCQKSPKKCSSLCHTPRSVGATSVLRFLYMQESILRLKSHTSLVCTKKQERDLVRLRKKHTSLSPSPSGLLASLCGAHSQSAAARVCSRIALSTAALARRSRSPFCVSMRVSRTSPRLSAPTCSAAFLPTCPPQRLSVSPVRHRARFRWDPLPVRPLGRSFRIVPVLRTRRTPP